MIKCLICGREFKSISFHVIVHSLNVKEYYN